MLHCGRRPMNRTPLLANVPSHEPTKLAAPSEAESVDSNLLCGRDQEGLDFASSGGTEPATAITTCFKAHLLLHSTRLLATLPKMERIPQRVMRSKEGRADFRTSSLQFAARLKLRPSYERWPADRLAWPPRTWRRTSEGCMPQYRSRVQPTCPSGRSAPRRRAGRTRTEW
jgi:hypothetical protein